MLPSLKPHSVEQYRQLTEYLRELPPAVCVETMRDLARKDLYFLLTEILHRTDMERPWLLDRCKMVEANPNSHVDLWAREHYKSTIITFGKTIQDILATHGEGALLNAEGAPREITVGIFSHTRPNAKKFLGQIMTELETNRDLIELFPDVLWEEPKRQAQRWSLDSGIVVKRISNPKESTVDASGLVDGQPTGAHYQLRLYDDVVTEKSVSTPEMIEKTTKAWGMSLNLGTQDGTERFVGTFYSANDTYSTMIERGIPARIFPATKDGTDDTRPENCVFMPSKLLTAKRKKMGANVFSTQMLLNPKGGLITGFRAEDLRYWPAEHTTALAIALIVDPASKKKKTSDYTAMWVIGRGSDDNWYVLDHVKDRLNLTERVKMAMHLHRVWNPIATFWEEYGLQSDIEACKWKMNEQNYRFEIYPLGGKMKKEDRIKRLQPIAEGHRLYMPEGGCIHTNYEGVAVDTIRAFINNEWNLFPVVTHDDGLDSLSRIEDAIVLDMVPMPSAPAPKSDFQQEMADEHYASTYDTNGWLGR